MKVKHYLLLFIFFINCIFPEQTSSLLAQADDDYYSEYKDSYSKDTTNSITKYKSGLYKVSLDNKLISKFYTDLESYFPNSVEVIGTVDGYVKEDVESFDIDYLVDEISFRNNILVIKELEKYYIYGDGSEDAIQGKELIYHYRPRNLNVGVLFANASQLIVAGKLIEIQGTNEVLVKGTLSDIKNAVTVLRTLDRPLDKVNIEVLVVEYRHGKSFNWRYDITSGTSGRISDGSAFEVNGLISGTYNFLSKLSPSFKFNLQALVEDQNANIVTNPHVVALNNEEAVINIKETQYVKLQTSGINGISITLQEIQASLDLIVTPHIMSNQLFNLDVDVDNTEFTPNSSLDQIQTISSDIKTKVIAKNGETLIIGGLVQFREFETKGGTPFLSKIPLLGLLFKRDNRSKEFIETVIYITPYMAPLTSRAYDNISVTDEEVKDKLNLNGKRKIKTN